MYHLPFRMIMMLWESPLGPCSQNVRKLVSCCVLSQTDDNVSHVRINLGQVRAEIKPVPESGTTVLLKPHTIYIPLTLQSSRALCVIWKHQTYG